MDKTYKYNSIIGAFMDNHSINDIPDETMSKLGFVTEDLKPIEVSDIREKLISLGAIENNGKD